MSQYTSYYLYQKYEKRGEQDWIPVYPNTYSTSGDGSMPLSAKTENDPACGYVPPVEPIYRWVNMDISTNWICDDCEEPSTIYRWIKTNDIVCAEDSHSYSADYLTFVALESGTFKFSGTSANTVQYSLDNGSTWTTLESGADSPTVQSGNKIMWKSTATPMFQSGIGKFSSTGRFSVEGNAMSLLYGDNFGNKINLYIDGYGSAFVGLFQGCTKLTNAENLSLPAKTLSYGCYVDMFNGCTSITTAPELPAISLTYACYSRMFSGCESLTRAPQLPATRLQIACYSNMFNGCTSLTTAPILSATTLADDCYQEMFYGCTSLTTAPSLPVTTLTEGCYYGMFEGCTSLATAPDLPATTLAEYCYGRMFYGCTSLATAPILHATTLVKACYGAMFYKCENINSITCLATDITAEYCTLNWVYGVSSSGVFTKAQLMYGWTTGDNGIPSNWTVQNY